MMPIRRNYNQNWLPSIFNDFFDNDWMEKANATAPAINVVENDNSYKIEVAAPGMTKEDFNIHLTEDNQLVISMEKKNETKDEKKKYLRREFSSSKSTLSQYEQLAYTCCNYIANPKISIHKQHKLSLAKVHFFPISNVM